MIVIAHRQRCRLLLRLLGLPLRLGELIARLLRLLFGLRHGGAQLVHLLRLLHRLYARLDHLRIEKGREGRVL